VVDLNDPTEASKVALPDDPSAQPKVPTRHQRAAAKRPTTAQPPPSRPGEPIQSLESVEQLVQSVAVNPQPPAAAPPSFEPAIKPLPPLPCNVMRPGMPIRHRMYRVLRDSVVSWGGMISSVKTGAAVELNGYGQEGIRKLIAAGVELEPLGDPIDEAGEVKVAVAGQRDGDGQEQ
jgi:hypothetical protein